MQKLNLPKVSQHAWKRLLVACVAASTLCGCAATPRDALRAPRTVVAPYDQLSGDIVWAVAPLTNESGVSIARSDALADNLVNAITDVQGISCLPFNRTLAAMEALGLSGIRSPAEAQMLAQALGADGIVVGTITSYDAYTPELGVALALFAKPGSMRTRGDNWNPKDLRTAISDQPMATQIGGEPLAKVHERFDAKNNQVLMDVQAFADGREKQRTALGWRRYLASMDLFSQFAMYRATDALVQQELVRLARANVPTLAARPAAGEQVKPERSMRDAEQRKQAPGRVWHEAKRMSQAE